MYARLCSPALCRNSGLLWDRNVARYQYRWFCSPSPKYNSRLKKIHYFNAAMICGLFTLYLVSDNIIINNGKIIYIGGDTIYYRDGFNIKSKSVKINGINNGSAPVSIDEEAIDVFKEISNGFPFVIYKNHTCVLLNDDSKGLVKEEILAKSNEIMKEYGPVEVGTPSGDFGMITRDNNNYNGYLITSHCPDMLTFVSHRYEMKSQSDKQTDIQVCLYGRNKRNQDGNTLKPIYWNNSQIDGLL